MDTPNSVPDDACCSLDSLYDDAEERIVDLGEQAPDPGEVATQGTVFKALANEKRLRILGALRDGELCVCELQAVLHAPQSTVATHLRTLKDAGLVSSRKSGKWTYYRIADTATFELLDMAAAIDTWE
ncbi:MAG: metalloregulator ArsR/SmtB family transcription factor [Halolamina sp.]|uniref:ArsR/SmtB family transcription factor n=1 Tax=Halolamina sp. TaxID=1940283 RepID=UPI002FC2E68D